MANRLKEDEKNEWTIRGLLKLPENRRCINCNSLGPQYVCTSFWTFVCTNCSGIHREFTHRVKSVSMAKFTSQEVSALQGGGNQRAKDVYFKEWDPQCNTAPDGSNVERLRDFIKHVYVDRRFSGERGSDRPPRPQSEDSYRGGSRSPPYEDSYDRRQSDRSSSGGRSQAYEQEYKKSPSQPEVVNDWRREDRFGNGRKVDDRRISDGESRVGGSPEQRRDSDTSSPPVVRPVREILGENVIPLKIAEPPKANGTRTADSSLQTQRTASSSSLGSTSGNAAEVKWQSTASLIDFDAEPEAPAVAVSQAPPPNQAFAQLAASSSDNNWASFDVVSKVKASQPPPIFNPLDSVLSQLSAPASSPAQLSGGHPVTTPFLPFNAGASTAMPGSNLMAGTQPGPSGILSGLMPGLPPNGVISSGMQPPSLFPVGAAHSTHISAVPVGGSYGSQPWNAPSSRGLLGTAVQPSTAEVKPPGRQELPADLFAATYSPYPAAVPMYGSPYGMGYNMQYNPAMMPLQQHAMPMYPPQSARSVNPFNGNEQSSAQAPTFPSMVPLQNSLPNVPPSSGLMHPSATGPPSQAAWGQKMPQQVPYQPTMPQQAPTYVPTMPQQAQTYMQTVPQGSYMGQQMPTATMPPSARPQVPVGYGSGDWGAYTNQQRPPANFSPPQTTNPSAPVGGNPFG